MIPLLLLLLLAAAPVAAQTTVDPPVRRLEVNVGGGWLGGASLGAADANLRANATTLQPYRVFSTDNRFAAAPSLHVRAGYALSRRFAAEGGLVFSRPALRSSLTADIEGAPSLTVDERVDQYFIEASLLFRLEEIRLGRATVPFVTGGVGYLRQLHQGLTFVEQGHLYHLGGGVTHALLVRNRGLIRSAGLRGDARIYLLTSGVSFDEGTKPHPAVSGTFFVVF